jgi:hypothetical protein
MSLNKFDPSHDLEELEFNDITLKFGSFLSMTENKCLNHISTIAIIIKNKEMQQIYLQLLGTDNLYECIQQFIQNTPNLYKKIAKKSLFQ